MCGLDYTIEFWNIKQHRDAEVSLHPMFVKYETKLTMVKYINI
jgi:hypothetical protein